MKSDVLLFSLKYKLLKIFKWLDEDKQVSVFLEKVARNIFHGNELFTIKKYIIVKLILLNTLYI